MRQFSLLGSFRGFGHLAYWAVSGDSAIWPVRQFLLLGSFGGFGHLACEAVFAIGQFQGIEPSGLWGSFRYWAVSGDSAIWPMRQFSLSGSFGGLSHQVCEAVFAIGQFRGIRPSGLWGRFCYWAVSGDSAIRSMRQFLLLGSFGGFGCPFLVLQPAWQVDTTFWILFSCSFNQVMHFVSDITLSCFTYYSI